MGEIDDVKAIIERRVAQYKTYMADAPLDLRELGKVRIEECKDILRQIDETIPTSADEDDEDDGYDDAIEAWRQRIASTYPDRTEFEKRIAEDAYFVGWVDSFSARAKDERALSSREASDPYGILKPQAPSSCEALLHAPTHQEALMEIARNAETLLSGGLPHFSRKEFAETVAHCARHALGQPVDFTHVEVRAKLRFNDERVEFAELGSVLDAEGKPPRFYVHGTTRFEHTHDRRTIDGRYIYDEVTATNVG